MPMQGVTMPCAHGARCIFVYKYPIVRASISFTNRNTDRNGEKNSEEWGYPGAGEAGLNFRGSLYCVV